ncbi:TniB family NTP-binding protein [Anaerolineales bacterium HSG6]|nr:TniB family NTP-binding protein [Anaerolineales bacterium HSG6]
MTVNIDLSVSNKYKRLIIHEQMKRLMEDISLCQETSKLMREAQCMALEGATGVGKSTLIQHYQFQFPSRETVSGSIVPILYVPTPTPITIKGMVQEMLDRLGDPLVNKGTVRELNTKLIGLLQDCEVELIIFDDFQHLTHSKTIHIFQGVSDWLKNLIKETVIPVLVIGIEGEVEAVLQANSQLSRLFAVRERLLPFQWDSQRPETMKTFMSFITNIEKRVGKKLSRTEIESFDLLHRLHYATDGVVANIMNLFNFAVLQAEQQGTDDITLALLAQSFDKRLNKHLRGKQNPFIGRERFIPTTNVKPEPKKVGRKKRPSMRQLSAT